MRKIDFFIQTLLMIGGLAGAIASIFEHNNLLLLMIAQFILGCWQMFGCFLSLIFRGPLFKLKLIHFVIASLYLASLALSLPPELQVIYSTAPAWALGIFYYVLSFKGTFRLNKDRGSFLPNLSF